MLAGLLSFVFSVIYSPGIASAATTPKWAFLSIAVPVAILLRRTSKVTLAHVLIASLVLYAIVSLAWTTVFFDGINVTWKLILFTGLVWIGAEVKSIRSMLVGASLALWINSIVVIAQVHGWHGIPEVVSPGGLFLNKNMGAEFAVLILVGLICERIWWPIPGLMPSIIYVMFPNGPARGAWLALGIVCIGWVGSKFPRIVTVLLGLGLTAIAGHYILSYDSSVSQRMDIWADTVSGFKTWGNGIGSFYVDYPHYATHMDTLKERPDHAHNDFLELVFELGIGSLLAVAFFLSVYRVRLATERSIVLAFLVESCFGFPLAMPATFAAFAFSAGRLAGAGPSLRDDLVRGRDLLRAWLVGIAKFCRGDDQPEKRRTDFSAGISDQKCPVVYVDCLPSERGPDFRGCWRSRKGAGKKSLRRRPARQPVETDAGTGQ